MLNDAEITSDLEERALLLHARQEIEHLRRWYALATDALGQGGTMATRGRDIYRRIFAADAQISVRGGQRDLDGTGPEAWAEIATDALAEYTATQHLIGTQVVVFKEVAFAGSPKAVTDGVAEMSSYLQAWHAWPDSEVRVVIGSYEDSLRFRSGTGWQIDKMVLRYQSGERRPLGDPP